MGRKLEFEPEEAVHKAMWLFWEKGYERTSVGDLEAYTGVGRKSLYRAFRDKEDLFLATLGVYRRYMDEENLAPLFADGADLTAISDFLHKLASVGGTPEGKLGCLICNTAVELGKDMPEIARHIDGFFDRIRAGMLNALRGARAKAEIGLPDEDLPREANFLLGIVQGICALGRSGAPRETLEDVANSAIRRFG